MHEQFAGRGKELLVRPNVTDDLRREAEAAAPEYFTAVWEIDRQVGRIMDALERLDLTEETVVVLTSDHGSQLGSHGRIDKNFPYEGSMRIPFIVSQPGRIHPGISQSLIGSLDFASTLLGLVGLPEYVPARRVGRDLSSEILAHTGPAPGSAVPFFHDEAAADGLTQRGIRPPTHMWLLAERAGEIWSTCHDWLRLPTNPCLCPIQHGMENSLAEHAISSRISGRPGRPWTGI